MLAQHATLGNGTVSAMLSPASAPPVVPETDTSSETDAGSAAVAEAPAPTRAKPKPIRSLVGRPGAAAPATPAARATPSSASLPATLANASTPANAATSATPSSAATSATPSSASTSATPSSASTAVPSVAAPPVLSAAEQLALDAYEAALDRLELRVTMLLTIVTDLDVELDALVEELPDHVLDRSDWSTSKGQLAAKVKAFDRSVADQRAIDPTDVDDLTQLARPTTMIDEVADSLDEMFLDIVAKAKTSARLAIKLQDGALAERLLEIADAAYGQANATPAAAGTEDRGKGRKGAVTEFIGVEDATNNVVTGLGGAAVGILGETSVAVGSLSTTAAPGLFALGVFSAIGGILGIVFGLIGTGLGLNAFFRGWAREKELRKLVPNLSSEDLKRATRYAANQKQKKKWRGAAAAAGGTVAITAGVIGLVALSIASFGLAAVILGISAAVIGLGFVVYKYARRRWKRAKEARDLAEMLLETAEGGDAAAATEAHDKISSLGLEPAWRISRREELTQALTEKLKGEARSQRQRAAREILGAVLSDTPSIQVQGELVAEALHLKPEKLRQLKPDKAQSKVEAKLASW